MKNESTNLGGPAAGATNAPTLPATVDRATFQTALDGLRVREKTHTRVAGTLSMWLRSNSAGAACQRESLP